MTRSHDTRRRAAARRGIASLEFVLILPLLLILLFGVLEYGWMFYNAALVSNAARDGARVGARADGTSADINAAVDARMGAANLTGYTVNITPAAVGDALTVEVIQPYDGNAELINFPLIPVPANLSSSISMRKEGP